MKNTLKRERPRTRTGRPEVWPATTMRSGSFSTGGGGLQMLRDDEPWRFYEDRVSIPIFGGDGEPLHKVLSADYRKNAVRIKSRKGHLSGEVIRLRGSARRTVLTGFLKHEKPGRGSDPEIECIGGVEGED